MLMSECVHECLSGFVCGGECVWMYVNISLCVNKSVRFLSVWSCYNVDVFTKQMCQRGCRGEWTCNYICQCIKMCVNVHAEVCEWICDQISVCINIWTCSCQWKRCLSWNKSGRVSCDCMWVYLCVWVNVWACLYIWAHQCEHARVWVNVGMCSHVWSDVWVCVRVIMSLFVRLCSCASQNTYVLLCECLCVWENGSTCSCVWVNVWAYDCMWARLCVSDCVFVSVRHCVSVAACACVWPSYCACTREYVHLCEYVNFFTCGLIHLWFLSVYVCEHNCFSEYTSLSMCEWMWVYESVCEWTSMVVGEKCVRMYVCEYANVRM